MLNTWLHPDGISMEIRTPLFVQWMSEVAGNIISETTLRDVNRRRSHSASTDETSFENCSDRS